MQFQHPAQFVFVLLEQFLNCRQTSPRTIPGLIDKHEPEQILGFSTNPEIITIEKGQTGFDITIASK